MASGSEYSISNHRRGNWYEGEWAQFRITRSGNTKTPGKVRYFTKGILNQQLYDPIIHGDELDGLRIFMHTLDPSYYQRRGAESNSDFIATNKTIKFKPGETSKIVRIKTLKDNINEERWEPFNVYLAKVNKVDRIKNVDAVVTIEDKGGIHDGFDGTHYVIERLNVHKYATDGGRRKGGKVYASEGDTAIYRIERNKYDKGKVHFFTRPVTASPPGDYEHKHQVVEFARGESYKDVTVVINRDNKKESNKEHFLLELAPFNNKDSVGGRNPLYIKDENPRGCDYFISRRTGKYINEGDTATFRISRSGKTSSKGKVWFSTTNGTARNFSDYEGKVDDVIRFKAGQKHIDININTKRDNKSEKTETFYASLKAIDSADTTGSRAFQHIRNEVNLNLSSNYVISRRSGSYVNEGSKATFRITRTGNTGAASSVRFYTSDGTAVSGSDFVKKSETIKFAAGETFKDVNVITTSDNVKERNEKFFVNLDKIKSADITGNRLLQYIRNVTTRSKDKPSLVNTSASINEDAIPGTRILDLADGNSGKDLDAAGNPLTYSIKPGNNDGLFSINRETGVITIAAGKSLNYDTKPTHKLTVQATNGSKSDSAVITINVKDVRGYPTPAITSPSLKDQTIPVNENIKPGNEIIDLSDESGGDTDGKGNALAYAISSGNEEQLFTINPSNGKITLSKEKVPTAKFLDYETQKSFVLGVSASAKGKTDTAQITVQVQNQTEQFNLGNPAPYSWGGDDITGSISNSATSDWVSLSINKGQSVSLGFNGSGTLDSQNNVYVKAVYNDFGHVVDNNEYFDPPENLTSFDVIAPYTGTYYVEVKARDGQTGSYGFGATDNGHALG